MQTPSTPLERLQALIAARRQADPAASYVAALLARGHQSIGRKVAEEALEVALAQTPAELVAESADLLFHLLVLLAHHDIPLQAVLDELARREGVSGLEEKANRKE